MVVSKLHVKLIRDIRFSPLMFFGIVFLLFVGIALFVSSYDLFLNLEGSYALSYSRLRLADFSIAVQSAPTEIVPTLRRIPGVERAEGRTVEEVEIRQTQAESRKVIGRIVSIPDSGEPAINQLKLVSGRYPDRGDSRQILIESSFAKYHDYRPGDTLELVIEEDETLFRITGIVQSPEYIYVVRGEEYPMPTPRTFGVMWMRESMVDELFGTSGSVNSIGFVMVPGANRGSAMRTAKRILDPYGAEDPVPQERQPSVDLLTADLEGLQRLAIFFPILFLTISSLSVYNMVSRMVFAQRSQIGFMRAVGLSRHAVTIHYLEFSLIVGVVGGILGSIAGHYGGIWITELYTRFIQIPYFDVTPRWGVMSAGLLLASAVTTASGVFPAIAAARLTPAEAIATEVPVGGRAPVIEKHLPFLRRFSLLGRLPLRNFLRNPRRSFSTIAGVASGVTLLLVSAGLLDSTMAAINFYFEHSIHYDVLASYLHPTTEFSLERIERWPGVRHVEPVLAMPAKLVKGNESQTILVYGVPVGGRLLTITTEDGTPVPVKPEGLMVAESTARTLDLWAGGNVRLTLPRQTIPETPIPTPPEGVIPAGRLVGGLSLPTFRESIFSSSRAALETNLDRIVPISAVTYQPVGNSAFASIGEVRRWYGRALELPPMAVNSVAMEVDPRYLPAVERRLYDLEGIASVEVIRYIQEEVEELLKQSQTFFNVMLAFSIALAGVIIFNSTLMNVIERTREIATLRTVGLSVRLAARLVWVENLMAYFLGIIIGLPFGTWLAGKFVLAYQSESFSMRSVIFPRTYMIALVGILITVIISQIPGIRYIRSIELAKATKDIG